MSFAQWDANADEHAGRQQSHAVFGLGIGKRAAHRDRAGEWVDPVVDEIDHSFVRISRLVLQAHQDREFLSTMGDEFASIDGIADFEQRPLVKVEVGIHRVERDDRGEQRLVLVGQVAQRQIVAADHPIDRRGDLAKIEVEFVLFHIGDAGIDRGFGLFLGRQILVDVLLADGARRLGDHQRPLIVGLGQFELSAGQFELSGGLIILGLVGTRIDLEQQIPLLDVRSFLEWHLDQIASHPRPDIDRVDRVGAAGVVDVVGDLALNGLADGDNHRGRLARRSGAGMTAAEGHER